MKLKDFILKLKLYENKYGNKEVKSFAKNGLLCDSEIMLIQKDKYDVLNISKENIDYIIIGVK